MIYLTNYVGPQVRTARGIVSDSVAGSKKSADLVRVMEAAGMKVAFLSLGWKRATWSLRSYPSTREIVDGRFVCEYGGLLDFPMLNLITNVVSVGRLVAKKAAEGQARGLSCRLLFYNPSVQMTLVALYARLVLGLPLYVQLEDGTHVIPTVGTFRRVAYAISQEIIQRLVSGAILVSSVMRKGYERIPHVICRGVAAPELASASHSTLDDLRIVCGRGVLTFLFGGTLDEIRGIDLLMTALEQADADSDFHAARVRFVITGTGPLESGVRERCEVLKRVRIEFVGLVDTATYRQILRETHVAMALQDPHHPYSQACFPSKVIEYMTAGILVLTTGVADIDEFADGGVVLLDPSSPQALVEIWKDIIDRPSHYAQIAAAGQALVLEQCSPDHIGLMITNLLK